MHLRSMFQSFSCWSLQNLTLLSAPSWKLWSSSLLWFPWQHPLLLASYFPGRIIFFCLLSSITLLLWSLKYYCGRGSIFSSLFSIPLVCLRGHSPLCELWCRCLWSPVSIFSSPPLSPELRTKVPVYLLDISTTKSCRHLETLGSPNWPHYFVLFCYLHSCLHFPSGYITLLFQ